LKDIGAEGIGIVLDDDGSQDGHQDEETNDTQAKSDLGVASKPIRCRTPAAFSLYCVLDVVNPGGLICRSVTLWEYQEPH
jgi:hypothetical protein